MLLYITDPDSDGQQTNSNIKTDTNITDQDDTHNVVTIITKKNIKLLVISFAGTAQMKIFKTHKYSNKFWVQKSAIKSLLKPMHRVTQSDRPDLCSILLGRTKTKTAKVVDRPSYLISTFKLSNNLVL